MSDHKATHSERIFVPLRIAVLTVSDTRNLDNDRSGQALVDFLEKDGHDLAQRAVVKDEFFTIQAQLKEWISNPQIQVIVSTGGTGISKRDVTPEAVAALWEKEIPGFGELFRFLSYKSIGPSTIQSRACAGVAAKTLIFALPGSPGACKDAWEGILRAQLDARSRPCNFVDMILADEL